VPPTSFPTYLVLLLRGEDLQSGSEEEDLSPASSRHGLDGTQTYGDVSNVDIIELAGEVKATDVGGTEGRES